MKLKITPKRLRKVKNPKNVECWVGSFVRRAPPSSDPLGLPSPPVPIEQILDRYLDDVEAEGLRDIPKSMEELRRAMEVALRKVWDITTGDDGMLHDIDLLDFKHDGGKGGKVWLTVPSATVLNMGSGFIHKDLCEAGTITAGSACLYGCTYCSVGSSMFRSPQTRILRLLNIDHGDAVIRRLDPVAILRNQLTFKKGDPRYLNADDRRVAFMSPIVDPLPSEEFLEETLDLMLPVFELTNWDIRILSKSMLVQKLASRIPEKYRLRVIYGLSIGILDDPMARAVERMTSAPTLRLEAHRELQKQGLRTYSMHCPIFPQTDYKAYAERLAASVNWEADERVWAEALNSRGGSNDKTISALRFAKFTAQADLLAEVTSSHTAWEFAYNRPLFNALAAVCPPGKLRYLVYAGDQDRDYWLGQRSRGAVVLGNDNLPDD